MSKIYTSNNTGGFAGSGVIGSGSGSGGVGGSWQQAQRLAHVQGHTPQGMWTSSHTKTEFIPRASAEEEPAVFERYSADLLIKELAKIYRESPLTDEEIDMGIDYRRRHLMNVISNQSRAEAVASLQDADVHADVSNILSMALLLY